MTTSQTNMNLCEPIGEEPVDFYTLKYMASYARHLAHEALLDAFQSSGLTRAKLARRLNWDRSRVGRLLNTPANMTVETFGELLFAIDGTSPVFECKKLLQEKPSNYQVSSNVILPYGHGETTKIDTLQINSTTTGFVVSSKQAEHA